MSIFQSTGQPEDFVSVSPGAPNGLPIDEIHCSVSRAAAVINLVMMALSSDDRPADSVLADALWGVQCDLELIKKMAYHAHSTTLAKSAALTDQADGE